MESIANSTVPTPSKSPIEFKLTMDAATHNSNLLEQVGYNLGKFIDCSYPGYSDKWELYTFFDGINFSKIASSKILINLRSSVDAIGVDILGFTSANIGTHSVRASSAMMMYLAKEPIYTIMLIGRWSLDAFLAYIEKQVKELTKGVSSRMLQ